MATDWLSLGTSLLGAGAGIFGANSAANAQERAAKDQGKAYRRNLLMGMGLQYPGLSVGNQALQELGGVLGYNVPGIPTQNSLMSTVTPISAKQVSQMLRQGFTLDQISQTGSLSQLSKKGIKRLTRAGLSNEQIMGLMAGRQGGTTGAATGSGTAAPAAPATDATNGMDFTKFYDSPDYQFRLNQSLQALDRGAAARGGALSGNAMQAGITRAGDLAANEFNNYWNRRMQLVNGGSNAANSLMGAGNTATQGMANAYQNAGDARASGILGTTNSIINGLGDFGNWWGSRSPSSQGIGLTNAQAQSGFNQINAMVPPNYLSQLYG